MSDPQSLFQGFAEAYRRDPATDPWDYLGQVEGTDREELAALIDRFLLSTPRRPWDPAAFSGSIAERVTASVAAEPVPAGWPELLPELRNTARLTRRSVVEGLAAALGAGDRQDRVGAYYHRMEHGQLPPEGVSDRVLDALAGILGSTTGALRRAGEAAAGGEGPGGEVFARVGEPADVPAPDTGDEVARSEGDSPGPLDDLDRLFVGGG